MYRIPCIVWAKLRKSLPCNAQYDVSDENIVIIVETYPWWPAVVFEPDDPAVDADVLQRKTPQEIKKHRLHLVRFYDNKDYWLVTSPFLCLYAYMPGTIADNCDCVREWLDPSKLKMLGDDKGEYTVAKLHHN